MTRILVTIFAVALFGLYSSLARADTSDGEGARLPNATNNGCIPNETCGVVYPAAPAPQADEYGNAPFEQSAGFIRAFTQGGSGADGGSDSTE